MSHLSNRSILEKADLALADLTAGGGILKPAQAQKFMRLLIKQSVLMQQATVVPMASPKQQISKIKFGSRILRPGQEATALTAAQRAAPDLSQVELDAKLFKAEVRLSDEVLEDSIERGELRQTMMEMIADAISRDMEEVLVSGDTASADPFLATMDGVLKQATSHVVDAAAAPELAQPRRRGRAVTDPADGVVPLGGRQRRRRRTGAVPVARQQLGRSGVEPERAIVRCQPVVVRCTALVGDLTLLAQQLAQLAILLLATTLPLGLHLQIR